MNKNEKELNDLLIKTYAELIKIKKSNAYRIGKKIEKSKLGSFILELKEKLFLKKSPRNVYNDEVYINDYSNLDNKKIVVYSCITGEYDLIIDPLFINENIDYVMVTNNKELKSNKWNIYYYNNEELTNLELNRYVKMHPYEFFKDYDYSIYVDGNLKINADISCLINRINKDYGIAFSNHSKRSDLNLELIACKNLKKGNISKIEELLKKYSSEGMPLNYGMLECPVIVVDLKNDIAKKILREWWNEFIKSAVNRDQFVLPYVLWKLNIKSSEIGTISNNIWADGKFEKREHNYNN